MRCFRSNTRRRFFGCKMQSGLKLGIVYIGKAGGKVCTIGAYFIQHCRDIELTWFALICLLKKFLNVSKLEPFLPRLITLYNDLFLRRYRRYWTLYEAVTKKDTTSPVLTKQCKALDTTVHKFWFVCCRSFSPRSSQRSSFSWNTSIDSAAIFLLEPWIHAPLNIYS